MKELTNCKWCEHYEPFRVNNGYGWCLLHDDAINQNDFCSKGERRIPENAMTIKVKYLNPFVKELKHGNGDWIDLQAAESKLLKKGEYYEMPLGVAVQLPENCSAIVAPRSSLFRYYGLLCANSFGVIDSNYCGDNDEWHFLIYATRDVYIPLGARICQFRVISVGDPVVFETVKELGNPDRGGLGSTGVF